MAGATTPDAIAFPTIGDTASPRTQMATQATSVQTALDKRQVYNYRWLTTAAMNVQAGMRYGDTGYNVETNKQMVYRTDNTWGEMLAQVGSYLVTPVAVAGTGISISGNLIILASTVGTVNVINCFTGGFDHYTIEVLIDSAAADGAGQFAARNVGGSISGGVYYGEYMEMSPGAGPTRTDSSGTTVLPLGAYATGGAVMRLDVWRPSKTTGSGKQFSTHSSDSNAKLRYGGGHVSTATALTGIDIAFPTAVTGRIKIYGNA